MHYHKLAYVFLIEGCPNNKGATILYKNYLAPFLEQHEGEIENVLDTGRDRIVACLNTTMRVIVNIVTTEFLSKETTVRIKTSGSTAYNEQQPREEPPPDYSTVVGGDTNTPAPQTSGTAPAMSWLTSVSEIAHPERSTSDSSQQNERHLRFRRHE